MTIGWPRNAVELGAVGLGTVGLGLAMTTDHSAPDRAAKRVVPQTIGILFVCSGNICRSPTAEGVFRALVERAGLADRFDIDSAGTHDEHEGQPPDRRAQRHAKRRGYDLSSIRARPIVADDFRRFDLLLAMDQYHLRVLKRMRPANGRNIVRLFLDYAGGVATREVPDPYYSGPDAFEQVLDLVEAGASGLLEALIAAGR